MASELTLEERQLVLGLARQAMEQAVRGQRLTPLDLTTLPERLREPAATFVTLTRRGVLRGCIGGLQAEMPLAEDVRQHAVAAALDDYRFPPVQPDELPQLEIEVSILTEPQPLPYSSTEELVARLRPGIDGVILVSGLHRATFLPQVWQKVPDAELFLSMLCEKAGLPGEAWRHGRAEIFTYQVRSFHEGEASRS